MRCSRQVKQAIISVVLIIVIIETLVFNVISYLFTRKRSFSNRICPFTDSKSTILQGKEIDTAFLTQNGFRVEHANSTISRRSWSHTSYTIWTKQIIYKPFNLTEPHFAYSSDRVLFLSQKKNTDILKNKFEPEELLGKIYVVPSGTFRLPYDCGWKSNISYITQKRKVDNDKWYNTLIPLIVPDGHTFQHFLDGTLPKLIQILHILQNYAVKVLLINPRDRIICEFLERLGISSKVVIFSAGNYGADKILLACNAPPIHPKLWTKARLALGAPEVRKVKWDDSFVVVVTRKGCFNCGRFILNMEEMLKTLYGIYGKDTVRVYEGPYNLNESIELFGRAKVVIGVHGGGMYNLIYCPKGTIIVEIMPINAKGEMLAASYYMIWAQAQMLGLRYWRNNEIFHDSRGNIYVNTKKLRMLLYKAERNL